MQSAFLQLVPYSLCLPAAHPWLCAGRARDQDEQVHRECGGSTRGVIEGGKDQKKEPAYGADVLRLWVSSVDYTNDVLIGGNILSQVCRAARRLTQEEWTFLLPSKLDLRWPSNCLTGGDVRHGRQFLYSFRYLKGH